MQMASSFSSTTRPAALQCGEHAIHLTSGVAGLQHRGSKSPCRLSMASEPPQVSTLHNQGPKLE